MKIAILTSFYPATVMPEELIKKHHLQKGHHFPWITNLSESLAKDTSCDVHVITISSKFKKDVIQKKNSVTYHFLYPGNRYLNLLSFYETERKKIKDFLWKNKFDIIHGQGFEKYGYFAVRSGKPNVITIHLFNNRSVLNFFKYDKFSFFGLLNATIRSVQQQWILRKMTHLISISKFITKHFTDNSRLQNIFEIENAIGTSFFDNIKTTDQGYFLFIGSIDARKSLFDLVKAVEVIPDTRLKIISGTNSGLYFNLVKDYIQTKKLDDRIDFIGHKKNEEIIEIIANCSCVVLPSKKEGAPMVISEAFAVGKPVIATNVDGIPYMIEENITGLLYQHGDIEMLIEKLQLLNEDSGLRLKMGAAAKDSSVNRWHPDIVAQRTKLAYETILNNNLRKIRN
jgi:glycosyltransferase involved in cell wall biosynthesis